VRCLVPRRASRRGTRHERSERPDSPGRAKRVRGNKLLRSFCICPRRWKVLRVSSRQPALSRVRSMPCGVSVGFCFLKIFWMNFLTSFFRCLIYLFPAIIPFERISRFRNTPDGRQKTPSAWQTQFVACLRNRAVRTTRLRPMQAETTNQRGDLLKKRDAACHGSLRASLTARDEL
jgi:hypothetical protein